LHAPADKKRIWADEEGVGAIAYKACEGSINLVAIARVRGIWTNLFGGSKKNSEENSEK
jgi:hypothetical protein